jgi:hypothetical protein
MTCEKIYIGDWHYYYDFRCMNTLGYIILECYHLGGVTNTIATAKQQRVLDIGHLVSRSPT